MYPERFAKVHGPLRPVVERVLREFLTCGLAERGFARCSSSLLVRRGSSPEGGSRGSTEYRLSGEPTHAEGRGFARRPAILAVSPRKAEDRLRRADSLSSPVKTAVVQAALRHSYR